MNKLISCLMLVLLSGFFSAVAVVAQEAADPAAEPLVEKEKNTSNKKMIRDATISLQTTVTGNQEQPRVMYILPWQSPLSPDLDIEMLNNQQDAVFGHVEREELQRGLEAAGEFDQEE